MAKDVAEGAAVPLQEPQGFDRRDDLGGGQLGHVVPASGRVRCEQAPQAVDLLREQPFVHGLPRHGQGRQGHQVDRVHRRRGVDSDQRLAAEVRAPVFACVRVVAEFDRFAEVDRDTAEGLAREPQALQDAAHRLAALGRTAQFAQIAAGLDDLLVTDVHRHDRDRTRHAPARALEGHAQEPRPGPEEPPRARSTAFDEVLHRMPAAQHLVDVLAEDRRVEPVVVEGPAHEERAAAPENAPGEGDVHVLAGGDVGNHEPAMEQDIGQQQVVHVGPVARRVDDRMRVGHRGHALDAAHVDAGVDAVPEPGQHAVEETDGRIGHVRGDRVGVAPRQAAGLGLLRLRVLLDDRAHGAAGQHQVHQRAAMGEVGPQGGGALIPELHAQEAGGAPGHAVLVEARVDDLVPGQGGRRTGRRCRCD